MQQEKTLSIGPVWYRMIPDSHAEVIGCLPFIKNITIPPMIEHIPVTGIAEQAFAGCSALSRITLPDSVGQIGKEAFRGCEKLRTFRFPNQLRILEESCFAQCFQLRNAVFPDTLETVGAYAFKDCISLMEVSLGKGCREIAPTAFQECPSLTAFHVPQENEFFSAEEGILYNYDKTMLLRCPETRDRAVFLDADTEFIPDAFDRCMKLPAIYADDNHPTYGSWDGVLYDKEGTTLMMLPQGRRKPLQLLECVIDISERALDQSFVPVMQVADNVIDFAWIDCCSLPRFEVSEYNPAFSDVDGVLYDKEQTVLIACYGAFHGTLVLPETVTMIDCGAVSGCGGVTEVILPEGLFLIDHAAFASCTALREADIPQSVTTIGDEAFLSCFSLEAVRIAGMDVEIGADAFLGCLNLTIYAPQGSTAEAYAKEHEIPFRCLEEAQ